MLELTNLSNADCDVEHILHGDADALPAMIEELDLDGIEFMLCAPWNRAMFPSELIWGVHLMFWPAWLDFWRGDRAALMAEFGSEENIRDYYGTLHVADWIEGWKANLRQAAACQPQYVVFHVAHNRTSEMYTRQFSASDEDVISAAIALVNQFVAEMPADCTLLFENLWWPGLTFCRPQLAVRMIEQVDYPHTGFMLDVGHLMNTDPSLRDEANGAAYVQKRCRNLGELGQRIYGIHLHQSLSGTYTREMMRSHVGEHRSLRWEEAMAYVLHVDRHEPFRTDAVRRIVETLQPQWLVHEFLHRSRETFMQNVRVQRRALGYC